jgi:hypothetical protein
MVLNALQAMPSGGRVELALVNRTLVASDVQPLAGGEYVEIGICDTGIGIPPEHLENFSIRFLPPNSKAPDWVWPPTENRRSKCIRARSARAPDLMRSFSI